MRKVLFLAALLLAARASAFENAFVVSDTVGYFEKAFGVRARSTAWFLNGGASTLRYSLAGKGAVSFRLTQAAPGDRTVDQIQVEPQANVLSTDQAVAFAKFLAEDVARSANVSCALTRNDQDGMNAFLIYACADKARPMVTAVEMAVTLQNAGGRNLVFVNFSTPKH